MSDLIIESLLPELAAKAREHRARAHALGLDVVFDSCARTWQEQMKLYEQGRQRSASGWIILDEKKIVTKALPDHDPHVRRAAYDLVPIVNEREAWTRIDLFQELGRIGKELGLVWGGDWKNLHDYDHFELANWRALPLPT